MNTSIQHIGRRPLLNRVLGLALCALAGFAEVAAAAPFTQCPAQAFLTQSRPALLYSVDLSTGSFASLGDLSTPDKFNALGFSVHDNYLYTWHYADQTLARVHADLRIESLALTPSLPMDYFVGDVAVTENAYYMYRRNSRYGGLWRIALDPADAEYLSPIQVAEASALQLKIFDLAFHPSDGYAYSVDSRGRLWRIDVSDGDSTELGNVGQSGTFGAVYFDDTGTLYISRNKDGKIFSIGVHSAAPRAELFSYGPASSNNDGARCALAPVLAPAEPSMDFGDAPASYGTWLEDDGARHTVDATLYLGAQVDAENRAFPAPAESDDRQDGRDDEDGIQFPTAFSPGESAIIEASVAGAGYLNIWLDYNRDGRFSEGERVLNGAAVSAGTSFHSVAVPDSAALGDTWLRARLSRTQQLSATGLAADGEVEDYAVGIEAAATSTQHYPSANDYVTLAFEDLWPSRGDYDMNDFVVYYRTALTRDSASERPLLREIRIDGQFVAVGAAFHSGFAISIPGLKTRHIDTANIELLINGQAPLSDEGGIQQRFQPLRGTVSRQDEDALLEITRDIWTTVERGEGCFFHRTDNACGAAEVATFSLRVPVSGAVAAEQIEPGRFNPFIFATNERLRNSIFTDAQGQRVAPGDGLEIHLKNQPPTWRAQLDLLARADDRSLAPTPGAERVTYQNEQGLPWAIEIGGRWCYPSEYQDLNTAYPRFASFVLSEGALDTDWFHVRNAASHPERGAAGYLYREDGVLDPRCN